MRRVYSLIVIALALIGLQMIAVTKAYATDLTVSCTAPTKFTDGTLIPAGTPITYNLYGALQGQTKTLLTPTPVDACQFVRSSVKSGIQCYEATAIVGGIESAHTQETCVTVVPAPQPPGNVAITVQVADSSAYKMRQSVDGFTFVAIGKIPVGTSCDMTHNVDGYSVVARSNVTLTSRFDTLPLVVYAKCS